MCARIAASEISLIRLYATDKIAIGFSATPRISQGIIHISVIVRIGVLVAGWCVCMTYIQMYHTDRRVQCQATSLWRFALLLHATATRRRDASGCDDSEWVSRQSWAHAPHQSVLRTPLSCFNALLQWRAAAVVTTAAAPSWSHRDFFLYTQRTSTGNKHGYEVHLRD